jgi:hypothetical protein
MNEICIHLYFVPEMIHCEPVNAQAVHSSQKLVSELYVYALFGLQPGWYVTLHVIGVPESLNEARQQYEPLVLVGLLPHEQKMSVLNFVIRRPNADKANQPVIRSKEQLIFHCGYRRFKACPIFSQHTNGTNHKVSTFTFKTLDIAQYCTARVSWCCSVGEIVPGI